MHGPLLPRDAPNEQYARGAKRELAVWWMHRRRFDIREHGACIVVLFWEDAE
jgi:hypothetical protein